MERQDDEEQKAENKESQDHNDSALIPFDNGYVAATALPIEKKIWLTKRNRLLWTAVIAILLALLAIYLIQKREARLQYMALLDGYNKEYQLIASDAESFKNQVTAGPDEKRNLKATISFYRDLSLKINFENRINTLNANPIYTGLLVEDKMVYASIGVETAVMDFKSISTDLDKLQGILQKSANIDNEIKIMLSSSMTIGDITRKADTLIKSNSTLKDDLLGIIVHVKLKEAQEIFVEALTYRETYFSQKKAANQAYIDAIVARSNYTDYIATAKEYEGKTRTATYTSTALLYIDFALEYAAKAKVELNKYVDKTNQSDTHSKESVQALVKYVELAQTDIDISKLKTEENKVPEPGPSTGDKVV